MAWLKLPHFPSFENDSGRHAWSFIALMVSAAIFTAFSVFVTTKLDDLGASPDLIAKYLFWIVIACMAQSLIHNWTIGQLIVRQNLEASKDGIKITNEETVNGS